MLKYNNKIEKNIYIETYTIRYHEYDLILVL